MKFFFCRIITKEAKRARKVADLAKVGSIECLENISIVVTKLHASGKMSVATIEALLRQRLRRMPKKTTKSCCDISQLCCNTIQD